MWRLIGVGLVLAGMAMPAGCEDDDGQPRTTPASTTGTAVSTTNASTSATNSASPIDLGSVQWLHANVAGWTETATLSSVGIGGGTITLSYDKANVWPGVNHAGANVNANPWVFVNLNGTWYAGTWEWLRVGQTSKSTASVHGSHIGTPPLNTFVPVSGTTYGFMVSGLARDSARNVQERSNVAMVVWP